MCPDRPGPGTWLEESQWLVSFWAEEQNCRLFKPDNPDKLEEEPVLLHDHSRDVWVSEFYSVVVTVPSLTFSFLFRLS